MIKKLIHVIIILALILAGAIAYLGAIALPVKVNTLVIEEIEKATGKKVLIESIRLNIFKGLVLEDLVIYDQSSIIVWAKSASLRIPLSSLAGGRIAIPAIVIDSPAVYLERRADNSFNIEELISRDFKPSAAAGAIALNRIILKNARVIFIDRTLDPVFVERIDDLSMDIRLSAPDKAALDLSCNIPLKPPIFLKFSGVYSISGRELAGVANVKGLALNEFKAYYRDAGIFFPSGTVDAAANLRVKDNAIEIDMDGELKDLSVNKDKLKARLDSSIKMMAQYDLKDKSLEYAGKLGVRRMDLSGVEAVGKLENIKADVEFNDSRLWSENILVDAYGMRWKARVNVVNFASPIFDIYADSEARLSVIQKMLKDEFGIKLPTDIAGKADIKLAIQTQPDKPLKMNGYVTLHGATISLGSGNFPIEDVTGEARFDLDNIKWSGIKLKYREVPYISSGTLADFASPRIELEAASQNLTFKSAFDVTGNAIKVSRLEGRYFSSAFSAAGGISLAEHNKVNADINGALEFELKDLKKISKNSAGLQKMKLVGKISAAFGLKGDVNNLKACDIRARIKSGYLSVYGLNMTDMIVDYAQRKGSGQIKSLRAIFYGGSLYATGKINWTARALPYSFNINSKDVKLENLKTDTGFRDKDVSGDIKAFANLSGTFKDTTRIEGTGRLSIANGKLWQLNLFKGVGSIIFTSDFSDIVFTEGSCDLKISNKGFIVNNFMLKSDLLNLYGSGTITPDRSVNAVLKPEVKESSIGPGAQERIAMAVSSNTVIKITGTFEKPEYKTQTNLADAMGGIASAIFQQ